MIYHDCSDLSRKRLAMKPTLVLVPCCSGAAWDRGAFPMLHEWPALAPVLPVLDGSAAHVAWLRAVTLAAAAAGVPRLQAVVASGGLAMNPLRACLGDDGAAGLHLAGAADRHGVLPLHGWLLASRYDLAGDRP